MVFIATLERGLNKPLGREVVFEKIFEPLKARDVSVIYVSTDRLQEAAEFKPSTNVEEGLQKFAENL